MTSPKPGVPPAATGRLPTSVCVYCGSSNLAPPAHKALARALGRRLAAAGIALIYGGGKIGLMGQAADGALEGGGRVIGIIPRFLTQREVGNLEVTELVVTDTMHERKRLMAERAEAFVVLPGGLGTLDETFEILTWAQIGLHDKPVVLLNAGGFWDPLLVLLDRLEAAAYVRPEHRGLLRVVTGLEELLPALRLGRGVGGEDLLERA
jgi:uncharacterized protein (TIGR00730 family)